MLLRKTIALSLIALAAPAVAQEADESALEQFDRDNPQKPVVANEPVGASALRDAMRRIANNPSDYLALTDAGYASLQLDDANAALNFFTRANGLRSRDARITAGLASAMVRTENPFEALRLFDEAVRLGASERTVALDRGLAFDLLGNFNRAQQDYQMARNNGVTDQLILRQVVSLSLAGRANDADLMLDPLLKRNVPEAWRTRAYLLAARGEYRESSRLAQDFVGPAALPKMQHYLGLMPNLTPAQQAAAIHLGHFPASHQIGRDSEEIKRVAATFPPPTPVAAKGDARLTPAGKPFGATTNVKKTKAQLKEEKRLADLQKKEREKKEKADIAAAKKRIEDEKKLADAAKRKGNTKPRTASATPPAIPQPVKREPTRVAMTNVPVPSNVKPEQNTVLPSSPPSNPTPVPESRAVMLQPVPKPGAEAAAVVVNTPPASSNAQPGFDTLGPPSTPSTSVVANVASPDLQAPLIVTQAPPAGASVVTGDAAMAGFDLGSVVAGITVPDSEKKPSVAAVDLSSLPPVAAPKTEPEAKPSAAKANSATTTASYWVQIATGDPNAMTGEFRRQSRGSPEAFSGAQGWHSEWKPGSQRLLVGPFKNLAEARDWESAYRTAGGDGFVWRSSEGQAVTPLGVTAPVRQAAKTEKPASKTAEKSPAKSTSKQSTAKSTFKQAVADKQGSKTGSKDNKAASNKNAAKTANSKSAADKKGNTQQAKATNNKSTSKQAAKDTPKNSSTKKGSSKANATKSSAAKTANKTPAKTDNKQAQAKRGTNQKGK